MATFEDFMKELQKEVNSKNSKKTTTKTTNKKKKKDEEESNVWSAISRAIYQADDDIAPVVGGGGRSFVDAVTKKEKETDSKSKKDHGGSSVGFDEESLEKREKERKEEKNKVSDGTREFLGLDIFQKGALGNINLDKYYKDGYQFGDVFKTDMHLKTNIAKALLGTAGDVGVEVARGIGNFSEGIADAIAHPIADVLQSDFVNDTLGLDTYGYGAGVRGRTEHEYVNEWLLAPDRAVEKWSVMGDSTDSAASGVGQVLAMVGMGELAGSLGMGAKGVGYLSKFLQGMSSFGHGITEARKDGASDAEAYGYGLLSAAAEVVCESLFSTMGKIAKSSGVDVGIFDFDDVIAKKVGSLINSPTWRNVAQGAVKGVGEGIEELATGFLQAGAKAITYMQDDVNSFEDFWKIVEDENLWEQFFVGMLTGEMVQSVDVAKANKAGRDVITGLNADEQTVVDKIVEEEIEKAEKDGKKVKKGDIEADIMEKLEKGYISTDDIERILGGDSYDIFKGNKDTFMSTDAFKEYHNASVEDGNLNDESDKLNDESDKLNEEYEALKKIKRDNSTLGDEIRVGEIQKRLGEIQTRKGEIQTRKGELKTRSEELWQQLQPERNRINELKGKLRNEVSERVKDGKLAESYRELVRSTQKFQADPSKYKSEAAKKTIQNLIDGGIANNTNEFREFANLMAKIADDKGAVFDITDNNKLKGTRFAVKGAQVNAFVDENGNITINKDSKKRLNSLVGHEITHVLEGTEFYTELQNAVKQYAQAKGEWDSRLQAVTDLYKKYKPGADPTKELTADLIGDYIFTDKDFVMNLSTKHRNVFIKAWDELKYLAKIATAGSREARELTKAKKIFEEVWRSTSKKPTKTEHSISEGLTAEQQEYFKDSVVRDERGNLKVMYHGTSKGGFNVFDTYGGNHGLFGVGSYFTDSQIVGESYTKKGKGSNPQVYEAYLNITNPIDMDAQADVAEWQNAFEDVDFPESGTNEQMYRAVEEFYADQYMSKWEVADIIQSTLESGMGYDGITHIGGGRVNPNGEQHRVYIAFNPEQIKRTDNQNPTTDADIRYSISEETDTRFTPTEIQTIQNIGRKSINNFTSQDIAATEKFAQRYWEEIGTKSPFYRAWFGDWRTNDATLIQVATQRGDTRGVQRNADTGWDIQVSGKVFSETRHHTDSYNIAARKYLPYINDIVRNAVLLDSHAIDPNKPKSQNTLLVHSMYAVADIGKGQEVLKLYVEEINNPNNTSTTKRSYQLQNIEKYRPTGKSSQNTASSISPVAGSVTTVADLFNYVKGLDKNFTPDASSKIVNADGTPKVMYHGSPAQFTIFDKSKAKSGGHYGKGFYFTDSTSHAGTYGNLYSVYLNIRNPLQSGGEAVSRSQVRKYLEAVAENEDYSIENYGTYDVDAVLDIVMGQAKTADAFQIIQDISATAIGDMVEAAELFNRVNGTEFDGIVAPTETVAFYPEQIKSATDNIGTFDKNNPDIRFSLSEAVEETKDLMALHNLHTNELLKQLDMGGMVYPSIAVTDPSKIAHEDFGDITAILHRDAIDPKTSKHNHIYSSDAYTPTFPHVSYEANREVAGKVIARVRAQFDSLPDYYQRSLRSLRDYDNLNNVLNNRGGLDGLVESYVDDHGMKQLYLAEKGEAVPMVINRTETELTDYQKALYQAVVDRLGKEELLALNDRGYYNTLGEARIAWTKEHLDVLMDIYAEDWSADGTTTKAEALEIANEQKLFYWYKEATSALEYLENGGKTVVEKEDLDATNAKVDEKIAGSDYKQWLNELFSGIEGLSGIRNNKDTFLPSGKRRSFAQLHDPVTIDNVIKVMRKKDQTGQGALGGNFGGAAVQEYKSIAEAKRNTDMLGVIDETDYKAIKQSIDDRLFDIARRYANGKDIIDARNAIVEAVAKNESKNGIERHLKQYDYVFEYKAGIAEEIIELRDYVRSLPRPYFEAKPRRAVGFDEVAVFVIPRNADIKLKQELLNRGYNIAEYDPDVEGDRQKVVNQFEEYKFSLSDVGEAQRSNSGHGVYGDKIGIRSTMGFDPFADIAPIGENVMPVAKNVQPVTKMVDNPFQDTLDPAQTELDNLLQHKEALEGRLWEALAREDFDTFYQLDAEYSSTMTRIEALENEITEAEAGRIESLNDADAPPETEAPYYGDYSAPMATPDPFAERNMHEVGNRKVKAYMYENPEVKPFFQDAARGMLGDLHESIRGEKWYNDDVYYESGGEKGWYGTKRQTTDDIAELLDQWHYTYDQIEKGLNAIIEDDGAENNAISKRIEFMLHDRLVNGYKSVWGEPIPADQNYIDFLKEREISEYYSEAFDSFMESADKYAPTAYSLDPGTTQPTGRKFYPPADALPSTEEIAPVMAQPTEQRSKPPVGSLPATADNSFDAPIREQYEAIRPQSQPRMVRVDTPAAEQHTAQILTEAPTLPKEKTSALHKAEELFVDKGAVFERLAKKRKNRELEAKYNAMHYSNGNAQTFIGEGDPDAGVDSLVSVMKQVGDRDQDFFSYMYHIHNMDRMTLAQRGFGEDKAVYGSHVTAEMSSAIAQQIEAQNPDFRDLAAKVYGINQYLRQMMVDGGLISQETANLWAKMYPHYVPISRADYEAMGVSVPLDTNKTGVNAPVKRATGGNSDISPMFDTMAKRILQTFRAIDRNDFGVELKNTLNSTIENSATDIDTVIDGIDANEELLQEGKNGNAPTFTVFQNGERVKFAITKEMYDAMKPTSDAMAYTNPVLNTISNIRRGLITEYNPVFLATNAIKDAQDVLFNSQHAAATYAKFPKAWAEILGNGDYYREYMKHGGGDNTYFERDSSEFAKEKSTLRKVVGFPLDAISYANNFIERVPRLAEYIASREAGRSIKVSMLDAARVTTNFAAGGDVTKLANRNGATFLNASVQGARQLVRNVQEAKMEGLKGWVKLAGKTVLAGLPAALLNGLLWEDDEEYEELSDYVKENYYIVAKFGDGQFVRIPKGRTVAVVQEALRQMQGIITGDDEADFKKFYQLVLNNIAPNDPFNNNVISPLVQAWQNKAWHGGDIVPQSMQDVPVAEQYDESTDSISKWLGERLDISPMKINYVLDQISGGVGDTILPMLTPEAERGTDSALGKFVSPWVDKFTTDSVLNNQNVTDFYDLKDDLTISANSIKATDDDILKSKYMNSVSSELSDLYKQKREIQNSRKYSDSEKYELVRDIQKQINERMEDAMATHDDIEYVEDAKTGAKYAIIGDRYFKLDDEGHKYEWSILSEEEAEKYKITSAAGDANYATDGTTHYRWVEPNEDSDDKPHWTKITDKQLAKQNAVTEMLGITPDEYWSNQDDDSKKMYDWLYENSEKYEVSKAITSDFKDYWEYKNHIDGLDAKDAQGNTVSGLKKERVYDYIESLPLDAGEKAILFKSYYPKDDTYNRMIINYLNSREDISYEEMVTILIGLDFKIEDDGQTITWD